MSASRVVDLGDAVRVGGRLRLGQQRGALVVGGEHELDQRLLGPPGASCATWPMRASSRQEIEPRLGAQARR